MENDEHAPLEYRDEDRAPNRSHISSHPGAIALRTEICEETEPISSGLEVAQSNPVGALVNQGPPTEPQVLQGARNFDVLGGSFLSAHSITYNITQLSPPPESYLRETIHPPTAQHRLQESTCETPRILPQTNPSYSGLQPASLCRDGETISETPRIRNRPQLQPYERRPSLTPDQEPRPRPTAHHPVEAPPTTPVSCSLQVQTGVLHPSSLPPSPPPSPEVNRKSFPLGCSDADLYTHLLLGRGPGYPMWCPGPNSDESLSIDYRRRGISIGDVGLLTSCGIFDFIFNIFLPGDHAVNGLGSYAPDGFTPCPWSGRVIEEMIPPGHRVKTDFVSLNITPPPVVSSHFVFDFKIRSAPGAICVLPTGALTRSVADPEEVAAYARKHAVDWYRHISGPKKRKVQNGSLYLITGATKADSWGVFAVDDIVHADGQKVTFEPLSGSFAGPGRYYWSSLGLGNGKARLPDDPFYDYSNQAVFITGCRISLGRTFMNLLGPPKGANLANLERPASGRIRDTWVPFPFQAPIGSSESLGDPHRPQVGSSGGMALASSSNTAPNPSIRRQARSPEGSPENQPSSEAESGHLHSLEPFHPSDAIHEYLLTKMPTAEIVITHDYQWLSVLQPTDTIFPGPLALRGRILSQYEPVLEEGVVELRAKRNIAPSHEGGIHYQTQLEMSRKVEGAEQILPESAYRTPPPSRKATKILEGSPDS